MEFSRKKRIVVACLTAFLAVLLSCGGGGGTTGPANFAPNPDAQPGVPADFNSTAPVNQPILQTPAGAPSGAPLGISDQFGGTESGGESAAFNPLTDEDVENDALAAGKMYELLWTAITLDGDDPDPKVELEAVEPGTRINLWAQYYASAGAELQFHWQMPTIGLNFIDDPVAHDQDGTYLIKFDYYVPFGSLPGPATLVLDIIGAKDVSIGIVIDPPAPDGGSDPVGTPDGLLGGHFDVDTTSYISPIYVDNDTKGSTDGHVHQYDDAYSATGINAFNYYDPELHNITLDVPADAKFKLIVANADLSPGGRIVINDDYYQGVPETYTDVMQYDDTALAGLPVYSFNGADGTTQLTDLGVYFNPNAILNLDLHPTYTSVVRKNVLGLNGEWRNGALTIQAVAVNADGTDNFTTDTSLSNGGVQGVATSGLLWETTLFWHWGGPAHNEPGWHTYTTNGDAGIGTVIGITPGELVTPNEYPMAGEENHAQMAWEDLIVNSDYDYNDMVISMHSEELRNVDQAMVQLNLNVKALARGAGYDHEWQFNLEASMPGAIAFAVINQYYADGTPHGSQRIWESKDGVSIPIFVSSRNALPPPPGQWATNVFNNQPFVDGDYCDVSIIFDPPVDAGTYTPAPYSPEIRVKPPSGDTYLIGLWTKPGDPLDVNGRPLGFIVPDTYAWPVEHEKIWNVYPGFDDWVEWINDQELPEPSPPWWDESPVDGLHFNLHLP